MLGSLMTTIRDGGPIILVLLALSLFSLTVIGYKIVHLWNVTGGQRRREAAMGDWQAGRRDEALAAVSAGKSPADRVTAYAMKALAAGLKGPALEAELTRRGNEELAHMNSFIRVLELVAMIGPLLGLLGTVTGMIQSFQMLAAAEGSANASVLAGGIWQALLTTAAGLMVAIPAAVAASLLGARTETAGHRIENAVGQLMLIEESKS